MIQRTIEVPRTALYHALGPEGAAAGEVWFLLHGYAQRAGAFLESLATLARPGRRLVAPEALSRFYLRRGTGEVGASWMTREERADEIRDMLAYLGLLAERELPVGLPGTVLGFSQGGAAAARWAVLGATRLAHVVSLGCPLPPDLDLEAHAARVRELRWTFALGDEDNAIDRAAWEAGTERLRATGVEPRVVRFPGGHAIPAELLVELD